MYVTHYREAIESFGALKLESALIAVTGPSYRLWPEGDRELCADLSSATGVRTITASLAIHEALEALHRKEISLVSPYPDWLTSLGAGYWEAAGYRVAGGRARLRPGRRTRRLRRHDSPGRKGAEIRPASGEFRHRPFGHRHGDARSHPDRPSRFPQSCPVIQSLRRLVAAAPVRPQVRLRVLRRHRGRAAGDALIPLCHSSFFAFLLVGALEH